MDPPLEAAFVAPPPLFGVVAAFVWGALWGSFLNVVIYRLPRGRSLVRPGSHCPGCGHPVRPWDNVPILSWLLLRGRCRDCRMSISPRYPLVEGLTAALSVGVWARYVLFAPPAPFAANLAAYLVFFSFAAALVAVTFIDIDLQIIPNSITFGGMALGVLASLLLPDVIWWESLLGVVVGVGIVVGLSYGYRLLRGQQGMGLGDAKLLGMIGAFLGFKSLIFVMFFGSVLGLAAALVLGIVRRVTGRSQGLYDPASLQEDEEEVLQPDGAPLPGDAADEATPLHRTAIAFGPYLAAAALVYLLVGHILSDWYLSGITGMVLFFMGG